MCTERRKSPLLQISILHEIVRHNGLEQLQDHSLTLKVGFLGVFLVQDLHEHKQDDICDSIRG
jgi:hypothetical protein